MLLQRPGPAVEGCCRAGPPAVLLSVMPCAWHLPPSASWMRVAHAQVVVARCLLPSAACEVVAAPLQRQRLLLTCRIVTERVAGAPECRRMWCTSSAGPRACASCASAPTCCPPCVSVRLSARGERRPSAARNRATRRRSDAGAHSCGRRDGYGVAADPARRHGPERALGEPAGTDRDKGEMSKHKHAVADSGSRSRNGGRSGGRTAARASGGCKTVEVRADGGNSSAGVWRRGRGRPAQGVLPVATEASQAAGSRSPAARPARIAGIWCASICANYIH